VAATPSRQLTSFVGREREVAEIKTMIGRSRLVTLTGTGGAGKTPLPETSLY
jgi:ABC-type sulfate/molybdate transport systems ATPase subunit